MNATCTIDGLAITAPPVRHLGIIDVDIKAFGQERFLTRWDSGGVLHGVVDPKEFADRKNGLCVL
jgi:hypothetical protein